MDFKLEILILAIWCNFCPFDLSNTKSVWKLLRQGLKRGLIYSLFAEFICNLYMMTIVHKDYLFAIWHPNLGKKQELRVCFTPKINEVMLFAKFSQLTRKVAMQLTHNEWHGFLHESLIMTQILWYNNQYGSVTYPPWRQLHMI